MCAGRASVSGHLRLELEAEAELVATSVDVFAVDEGGERQLDSCTDRQRGETSQWKRR